MTPKDPSASVWESSLTSNSSREKPNKQTCSSSSQQGRAKPCYGALSAHPIHHWDCKHHGDHECGRARDGICWRDKALLLPTRAAEQKQQQGTPAQAWRGEHFPPQCSKAIGKLGQAASQGSGVLDSSMGSTAAAAPSEPRGLPGKTEAQAGNLMGHSAVLHIMTFRLALARLIQETAQRASFCGVPGGHRVCFQHSP